MEKQVKLTYIDLFAGCGGLSLGLYNSGHWHGLFAIEKNADAFKTLRHNLIDNNNHFSWPSWLGRPKAHDIDELLSDHATNLIALRGKVDLVAGGPPCQGFSLAGRRAEKDQRNNLAHSYLKFIELVQPNAILFENVKGFGIGFKTGDSRGVPFSKVVLDKLHELGYEDATHKILDFSEFGVPQQRKRFIIVATRNGTASKFFEQIQAAAPKFLKQRKLAAKTPLKAAISDIQRKHGEVESPDSNNFMAGVYSNRALTSYQTLMRTRKPARPDSHRFAKHTPAVQEKFAAIIKDRLTSREVREQFNTKKSSTKLLRADEPTPTLTTLPDDYVHYCEPRILTVREYARIQSFPDWYEFKGKYTTGGPRRKIEVPRYSQIGNAIPPLFGELAGVVLGEIIDA